MKKRTNKSIALIVAAVYVSFIMNPGALNIFAYIWAVGGFSVIAYLQSFLFRRAFQKISPELLDARYNRTSGPAEGAVFTDEEHRTEEAMAQESSYSNPDWNRREDILGGPEKKSEARGGKKKRRR